ncbi:MAG TPA: UDP-2,4-diacetamido-2,4,6-trideoxy-beta-L-altropyranose hydrolase [Anaerolineae bacterium]|nr:UDP-2,4-diacetamido-2,4,6-trideoxy-beta-L-altropyranose hydrolase [Anaerolineae bacterium]
MSVPHRRPADPGLRPPLLVRADASPQMGTGHVMRCIALAQAWLAEGGRVVLAAASLTPSLEAWLQAEGIAMARLEAETGSPEDVAGTLALADREGAGWLVVDGYGFSGEYQRAIVEAGLPLLAIDDYGHAGHYWAGLVLNQNLDAREEIYRSREPAASLLLGTRYALLRREFLSSRDRRRTIATAARRVLVTMGGADPANATLRVIAALGELDLPGLEAKVVVGGSNPHLDAIRKAARRCRPWLGLVENVTNMPELMAWADLAVSSAGTTCWELALMQLPALLLVLADNQRPNAQEMERLGAAVSLGWHGGAAPAAVAATLRSLLEDPAARAAMAQAGAALVDGRGSERVACLLARGMVLVRAAGQEDRGLLFGWANDPVTRRMSFRMQPIAWAEHVAWFDRVVGDPATLFYVGEAWQTGAWAPCGQVRVDPDGTVSMSVAPGLRGRGLAVPLLRAAVLATRARTPGRPLLAHIKPENDASQRVFEKVGFRREGDSLVHGQMCGTFTYGGRLT